MSAVLEAVALIDQVLGVPDRRQVKAAQDLMDRQHLGALGILPHEMDGLKTKGCRQCGGTMYWTTERDGSGQWVCRNVQCAAVE